MRDPRVGQYADLLLDTCLGVQPGWEVLVLGTPQGRALLEEIAAGPGRARHRLQPGTTRYMKNTLFDEKIDGTIHVALGNGFPDLGGTSESAIHWDIVKDVREGGRIELDGALA